ncbi:hypothetical protein ES703_20150 [subsurface metagenome]
MNPIVRILVFAIPIPEKLEKASDAYLVIEE